MDTDQTLIPLTLSVRCVLLGLLFTLLAALAICFVALPVAITFWMWTASREIARGIKRNWTTFNSGGLRSLPLRSKHSAPLGLDDWRP